MTATYAPTAERIVVQSQTPATDVLEIAQRIAGLRNGCAGKGRVFLITLTVLDTGAMLWSVGDGGKVENQGSIG